MELLTYILPGCAVIDPRCVTRALEYSSASGTTLHVVTLPYILPEAKVKIHPVTCCAKQGRLEREGDSGLSILLCYPPGFGQPAIAFKYFVAPVTVACQVPYLIVHPYGAMLPALLRGPRHVRVVLSPPSLA